MVLHLSYEVVHIVVWKGFIRNLTIDTLVNYRGDPWVRTFHQCKGRLCLIQVEKTSLNKPTNQKFGGSHVIGVVLNHHQTTPTSVYRLTQVGLYSFRVSHW